MSSLITVPEGLAGSPDSCAHREDTSRSLVGYPTTNVQLVERRPNRLPEFRTGDWYVIDARGREIARLGDRWAAVRLLGPLAVRDHPALPLKVFDALAHATGDRLG